MALESIKYTNVIHGDIPVDLSIKNKKKFLFISKDQRLYTHGIHKYPAKFFPELPRWAIYRYSDEKNIVIDPFMGSGTTNLECLLLGRHSSGIDVDPFSRFLSKVKTTFLNPNKLEEYYKEINSYLNKYERNKEVKDIPSFPYRDNWFNKNALHELTYIINGIDSIIHSKNIKDFFLITFSSIIRQCSQADNNCTRTVIRKKLNKIIPAGYTIDTFRKKMNLNIDSMLSLVKNNHCFTEINIPEDMSATNLHGYGDSSFDLSITSPPYVNAVDYPRTHQLELYWLGLASGSLRDMKKKHVGTEVVTVDEYRYFRKTGILKADKVIKEIFKIDKRRAYIASKYILDMIENLKEIHRVLKSGGKYVMVVGSNRIRGKLFENWQYLKEAAVDIGFKIDCVFISGIINHFIKVPRKEQINEDYVLVMRK